jgi:hypothetical protein
MKKVGFPSKRPYFQAWWTLTPAHYLSSNPEEEADAPFDCLVNPDPAA